MVRIHQHATFQAISSMGFPENAWEPQIWPVSLSQNSAKIRKINRPWPRTNQFKGGQDTSACKISGHSLHAFSRKCPETPNLTRFTKSKWCQNYKNQQTVTQNYILLKVVKIHQPAKFQVISFLLSPGNARKPQIWPVSLSQNSAKIKKINRLQP